MPPIEFEFNVGDRVRIKSLRINATVRNRFPNAIFTNWGTRRLNQPMYTLQQSDLNGASWGWPEDEIEPVDEFTEWVNAERKKAGLK